MTQAQLDFHSLTPYITQEHIDLQNQLKTHTTDPITKPLSNDSPVLLILKIFLLSLQMTK